MPPSVASSSTHYALVIDAGSSGSRLQIYSWRDPDLERAEIIEEVRSSEADIAASLRGDDGQTTGGWPWVETPKAMGEGSRKWWWPSNYMPTRKGKGKDVGYGELEQRALRRLVRVGKGVEGDEWVKRAEPGISTVAPADIPAYLAPLLTHALQQIPPSQHALTPIYIYATAGMRLLSSETQSAILQATCDLVRKDYPFRVGRSGTEGPCGENIRVISGEEEGLWGWVAVNYLMDGFGHAPPYGAVEAPPSSSPSLLPLAPLAEPPPSSAQDSVTPVDVSHHSPTFGFLDMGGASTQLAFSPSELELSRSGYPTDELRKVSLRLLSGEEVDWQVFVASWLGFGTNRVRERYVETLLASWRNSARVADLTTPLPDPCLPVDLLIPSAADGTSPPLIGTGSFDTCLKDLKPLLDRAQDCPAKHCLFAGLPTPQIDFERDDQRGFIGVSEYWYTAQQVLGLGGIWDWGEWETGMGDFCGRDWKAVEEEVEREKGWRGAQLELSRLQMQCFKGAWISNVLHEGIGIPRLIDSGGRETLTGGEVGDTNAEAERRAREKGLIEGDSSSGARHHKSKSHFQSMDEIGSTAISWTLGKMVIEASKAVPPRSSAQESAWRDRLPSLGLVGVVGTRLEDAGIHAAWAYIGFIFLFLVLAWNWVKRRKFPLSNSPRSSVRRKPSLSGGSPMAASPTSWSFWPAPADTISLEDGYRSDSSSSRSGPRSAPAKLRALSLRLTSSIRRLLPFSHRTASGSYDAPLLPRSSMNGRSTNTSRHASMPIHTSSTAYSPSYSQPSSPRGSFFTPALFGGSSDSDSIGLTVPFTRPGSTSPEPRRMQGLSSSQSVGEMSSMSGSGYSLTPQTSPPRNKSRPLRARQNSYNIGGGPSASAATGGWNDPPTTLFAVSQAAHGGSLGMSMVDGLGPHESGSSSGVLTPSAGAADRVLSRQSSRVNLSDMGLKERSGSRLGLH